eukprot:2722972-Amphidinium_carterae.2
MLLNADQSYPEPRQLRTIGNDGTAVSAPSLREASLSKVDGQQVCQRDLAVVRAAMVETLLSSAQN